MQGERERAREMLPGDLASALRAPLEGRRRAAAADPPGAASAALAVALARDPAASCVLAVLAGPRELEAFAQDAAAFLSRGDSLRVFPMLGEAEDDPEAAAARAEVLRRLRGAGGASPPLRLLRNRKSQSPPIPKPPKAIPGTALRHAGGGQPLHTAPLYGYKGDIRGFRGQILPILRRTA